MSPEEYAISRERDLWLSERPLVDHDYDHDGRAIGPIEEPDELEEPGRRETRRGGAL